MKKTFFLLTLLLGLVSYAQEDNREINTEFKELMDATFAPLEKDASHLPNHETLNIVHSLFTVPFSKTVNCNFLN